MTAGWRYALGFLAIRLASQRASLGCRSVFGQLANVHGVPQCKRPAGPAHAALPHLTQCQLPSIFFPVFGSRSWVYTWSPGLHSLAIRPRQMHSLVFDRRLHDPPRQLATKSWLDRSLCKGEHALCRRYAHSSASTRRCSGPGLEDKFQ